MKKKLEKHIKENIRDYFIFALILIIGIFMGTLVLNNSSDLQKQEITSYINDFNTDLKNGYEIDYSGMILKLIKRDLVLAFLITFLSISIIGVPAIYLIIGYKGFCIGYTISAISATLGMGKGLLFSLSLMFLGKLIEIPAIFFLALSGMKMYKMIIKDRSRENIIYSIRKFVINLVISLAIFAVSILVETYISSNLFLSILKYF